MLVKSILLLVCCLALCQQVFANKISKARLNKRSVCTRKAMESGACKRDYPGYTFVPYPPGAQPGTAPVAAAMYPPITAAAPAASAPKAAAPLDLGGLLSNVKLPALPSFAPPAGGAAGTPYFFGAPAKKKEDDDDDDDDKEDDDEE